MSIEWTGIPEFLSALDQVTAAVNSEIRAGVVEIASKIERESKRAAPVRTGTLERGIEQAPVTPIAAGWETRVYPTVIYSRRVELGFHGADSLGRNYDQQGRPYFGPAVESAARSAQGIFAGHMRRALTGA